MKMLTTLLIIVGLISINSCNKKPSKSAEKNMTTVEITIDKNSQMVFEGKPINIDNFSQVASNRIDELTKEGVGIENIIVSLKAGGTVEMGIINDIQDELRDLDLRRIKFSTI